MGAELKQPDDYSYGVSPHNVDVQISKQLEAFPGMCNVQVIKVVTGGGDILEGTDGLMAFPFLTDLGVHFGIGDPLNLGYGSLCKRVLEGVASTLAFKNLCNGELDSEHVRINALVREKLQTLERWKLTLSGDAAKKIKPSIRFHVMPVSMGASLAGHSPHDARQTAMSSKRLPLGAVQNMFLLQGWPERLDEYQTLWIYCSADEFDVGATGKWLQSLCVGYGGELGISDCDAYHCGKGYGAPVASLGK